MKRNQRKAKRSRAKAHTEHMGRRKRDDLHRATHLSLDGIDKLKRPRAGKTLRSAMEKLGYVQNEKGIWRRLPRQPILDAESKTAKPHKKLVRR